MFVSLTRWYFSNFGSRARQHTVIYLRVQISGSAINRFPLAEIIQVYTDMVVRSQKERQKGRTEAYVQILKKPYEKEIQNMKTKQSQDPSLK